MMSFLGKIFSSQPAVAREKDVEREENGGEGRDLGMDESQTLRDREEDSVFGKGGGDEEGAQNLNSSSSKKAKRKRKSREAVEFADETGRDVMEKKRKSTGSVKRRSRGEEEDGVELEHGTKGSAKNTPKTPKSKKPRTSIGGMEEQAAEATLKPTQPINNVPPAASASLPLEEHIARAKAQAKLHNNDTDTPHESSSSSSLQDRISQAKAAQALARKQKKKEKRMDVYNFPSDAEESSQHMRVAPAALQRSESEDDRIEAEAQLRRESVAPSDPIMPEMEELESEVEPAIPAKKVSGKKKGKGKESVVPADPIPIISEGEEELELEPEPITPSKKALGKRKFSEGSSKGAASAKKQRRSQDSSKVSGTPPLSSFGFKVSNGEKSTDAMDLDFGNSLGNSKKIARELGAKRGEPEIMAPRAFTAGTAGLQEGRRPTPQFTAINAQPSGTWSILPASRRAREPEVRNAPAWKSQSILPPSQDSKKSQAKDAPSKSKSVRPEPQEPKKSLVQVVIISPPQLSYHAETQRLTSQPKLKFNSKKSQTQDEVESNDASEPEPEQPLEEESESKLEQPSRLKQQKSKSKSKSKPKFESKSQPPSSRKSTVQVDVEADSEEGSEPEPEQSSRPKQRKSKSKSKSKAKSKSPAPTRSRKSKAHDETDADDASEFDPEQAPKSPPRPKPNKKRRRTADMASSQTKGSKTLKKETGKRESSRPASESPEPQVFLSGPISKEKLQQIMEHIESYRDMNDMTPYDLNAMISGPKTKEGDLFWAYVCEEYPEYSRKKLKSLCRRKFNNCKRGTFDDEDDRDLRDLHEKYPDKWKKIGEIMNRFPEDCRDRWRNYLLCGDKQRKDAWDPEEEEKLRTIVHELLKKLRGSKELVTRTDARAASKSDEDLLDWKMVSEKMGHTRSRLQCSTKWKIIKDIEASDGEDPVAEAPIAETKWRLDDGLRIARAMTPEQKLVLLYAIRDSNAGREGKIPWKRIHPLQPKLKDTTRMALRLCFRNLKEQVEGYKEMKFKEIVDVLVDVFETAAPDEPKGFDVTSWKSKLYFKKKLPKRKEDLSAKFIDSSEDDYSEDELALTPAKKSKSIADLPEDSEVQSEAGEVPPPKPRSHKKKSQSTPADSALTSGSSSAKNSKSITDPPEDSEEVPPPTRRSHKKESRSAPAVVEPSEAAAVAEDNQDSAAEAPRKHKKKLKSLARVEIPEASEEVALRLEEAPVPRRHKKKSKQSPTSINPPEEVVDFEEATTALQQKKSRLLATITRGAQPQDKISVPTKESETLPVDRPSSHHSKKHKSKSNISFEIPAQPAAEFEQHQEVDNQEHLKQKRSPQTAITSLTEAPAEMPDVQENDAEKPKKRKRKLKSTPIEAAPEIEDPQETEEEQPKKRRRKLVQRDSFVNTIEAVAGIVSPFKTPHSRKLKHKYSSDFKKSLIRTHTEAAEESEESMPTEKETMLAKKRKKLRDSMKVSDESQSQSQTGSERVSATEDLMRSLGVMRNGNGKNGRGGGKIWSKERITESDNESVGVMPEVGNQKGKKTRVNVRRAQKMWESLQPNSWRSSREDTPEEGSGYTSSAAGQLLVGGRDASEFESHSSGSEQRGEQDGDVIDVDEEPYTVPGGQDPILTSAEHTSVDEMEVENQREIGESSQLGQQDQHEEHGSLDTDEYEDEERTVTMNGFKLDGEEEGSVDLDTPRPKADEVDEGSVDLGTVREARRTWQLDELEVSSDDEDEEIPAVPRRKERKERKESEEL